MDSNEICTFCGHDASAHTGRSDYRDGCTAPACLCAVYSSPEDAQRYPQFKADAVRAVTITAQDLANRIHALKEHQFGAVHLGLHSCACLHLALYYLGLRVDPGVYWPDGKGGNAWAMHIEK